jgi:hypothetical protein
LEFYSGGLKRYSTKSMDLRPDSTFFLQQICGGAAGVGCVRKEKVGVELYFRMLR